jgi:hypothetical protein
MGITYNPSIVSSGLVLALDAANPKSYDGTENLSTYSEDISQNQYNENVSISTNQITSPDGTTTADKLTSTITGGTNTCLVQKFSAVSIDTAIYTFSVFLKAGTSSQTTINLQLAGGTYQQSTATINWTSNTITFSSGGTSALVSYPNGWYRVSITLTNNGTNNAIYPRVYVRGQGTDNVNGEFVYIWGWQTERGSTANPYYPTTASTKTRGTTLIDLSGNGYNMTLTGSPTFSSSNGGVLQFNGSNQYGTLSSLNYSTSTFTIIAASRYSGATRGRVISSVGNNWLLGSWGSTTENYYAEGWISSVAAGANDTNWRIYAATENYSSDLRSLYVNNIANVTNSTAGSAGFNGLSVGRWGGGASEYSTCEVSFIQVYNRILTTGEISQNFNALRGRYGI